MLGPAIVLGGTTLVYLLGRMGAGGLVARDRSPVEPPPMPPSPMPPDDHHPVEPPPAPHNDGPPVPPPPGPEEHEPEEHEPEESSEQPSGPPTPPPPPVDEHAHDLPTPAPEPTPEPEPEPAPAPGPVNEQPPPVPAPEPEPVEEPEETPNEPAPPPVPTPPVDEHEDAHELPTPEPEPTPAPLPSGGAPAGFDPTQASMLAPEVAANITARKWDYDHAALKAFQRFAGIASDGIYGGESYGALAFYLGGASLAPKALFKPTTLQPYAWADLARPAVLTPAPTPPAPAPAPSPGNVEVGPIPPAPMPPVDEHEDEPAAAVLPAGYDPVKARKMAKQVANNIQTKSHNYDRAQLKQFQLAAGLVADGIYGGASRGALIYYGVPRPPRALYKPTADVAYVPPGGGAQP